MSGRAVRVLVVDDSMTARALLTSVLDADPDIEVVGEASDGEQALILVRDLRPSVIVMDIEMPGLDGFETTRRVMVEAPTPIVVVTGKHDPRDVAVSLRATQVGALTVLPKPPAPTSPGFGREAARLVSLVKALAEVKVVRRRPIPRETAPRTLHAAKIHPGRTVRAVGVAASTGGPAALYRFLTALPADVAVPILVVQHIANGFVEGLVRWLRAATPLGVEVAVDGEPLAPATVHVAGDGAHLAVDRRGHVSLRDGADVGGFRPSATVLFTSLAEVYGRHAAAVVLTGMGTDGLDGVRALASRGGLIYAQDEDSSTVFGMPGAVIKAGLADVVGPVEALACGVAELAPARHPRRQGNR